MTKKRTSLDAILRGNVKASPSESPAPPLGAVPPSPRREKVKGTRQHSVYIPHAAHEQLRRLAFDEDGKMHDYLILGLDLVFRQKGLPSIAELMARDGGA
jgi:hypothetical protein